MAGMQQYSQEETFMAIQERAKIIKEQNEAATPTFQIKVSRKGGVAHLATHIATLSGAVLEHITQPEAWLAQLMGGGDYVLEVMSTDNLNQRIGGRLSFSIDPSSAPRKDKVDVLAATAPGWEGPRLVFPSPKMLDQEQRSPGAYAGATAMANGQTPGFVPNGNNGGTNVTVQAPASSDTLNVLAARERELAAREARAIAQETEAKRVAEEARLRQEFSQQTAALTAQIESLKTMVSRPVEPPKGIDAVALIGSLAPILMQYLQAQASERQAQAQRDEARAKEARDLQLQQMQQFSQLMEKMSQRPAIDESTKLLIETLRSQQSNGGPIADMMTRMTEAMSTVSKTSISMIQAVSELGQGPEESPVVGAIREAAKTVALIAKGNEEASRRVARQLQPGQPQMMPQPAVMVSRQMPPQPMPQAMPPQPTLSPAQIEAIRQQQLAEARARSAMENQAARRAVQATGAIPTQPQMPVASPTPAPQPAQAPISTVAEMPVAPPPAPVDLLELLIRNETPAEQVAGFLIQCVQQNEPSLMSALEEYEGDPVELFAGRLGLWALDHKDYVENLKETIDRMGEEVGLWEPDEEAEGELEGAPEQ